MGQLCYAMLSRRGIVIRTRDVPKNQIPDTVSSNNTFPNQGWFRLPSYVPPRNGFHLGNVTPVCMHAGRDVAQRKDSTATCFKTATLPTTTRGWGTGATRSLWKRRHASC